MHRTNDKISPYTARIFQRVIRISNEALMIEKKLLQIFRRVVILVLRSADQCKRVLQNGIDIG